MKYKFYPDKLIDTIHITRLIPRILKQNELLKPFCKYWNIEYPGVIKVISSEVIENINYYYITYGTGQQFYGVLTYPVPKNTYELLHNKYKIEEVEIRNSNVEYTGAEIKYWFSYNDIDITDKASFIWMKEKMLESKKYLVNWDKDSDKYIIVSSS